MNFNLHRTAALVSAIALFGCLQVGCKNGKSDEQKAAADSIIASNQTISGEVKPPHDTLEHMRTTAEKSDSGMAPIQQGVTAPPVTNVGNLPPAPEFEQDTTKKYVYLTFDDGPQPGTMNVYHILQELGVKGTFFMVGLHATYGQMGHIVDTIRSSYPNILLANHSYTHANGHYIAFYRNHKKCLEDFMKAQRDLKVERKYIRLPGNSGWVLQTGTKASGLVAPVCKLLDSAGYSVFGWDVEWSMKRDPKGSGSVPVESADRMIREIEGALTHQRTHRKNTVVLLSHDRMFHRDNYRDSLYKVVSTLKTKHPNYIFETVENYPGANRN